MSDWRNIGVGIGCYTSLLKEEGESGSGKSTLLNMLGALDVPDSGKVLIDGKDTFSMKERKLTVFRRRNIGFIGRPDPSGVGRRTYRSGEVQGMKSYLSLIPISAKVRRRQNRMTILCVIISVFLVTTIFSVADMIIRTEGGNLQDKHGSWHIQLEDVSPEIAEEISRRPDVTAVGWSENFNLDADQPYYIGDKRAALYGTDSTYLTKLVDALEEGDFLQGDHEVMLSSNVKLIMDVQPGDSITITTPVGTADFIVSGFGADDRKWYQGQNYLVAVYMTRTAFVSLMEQNGIPVSPTCYLQFQDALKASAARKEIQQQYGLPEESISENTAIMGIAGQSSNSTMHNLYGQAAILFVLVLLAGVLMISGSMNSNVAQRTKFFGMMRCIGANRGQIIRYVRLEALNWCKTAVPVGLILGTAISWGVCALLHYGIGGEFAATPVFAFSPAGLISGAVVGIVTVLLAAQSPASCWRAQRKVLCRGICQKFMETAVRL